MSIPVLWVSWHEEVLARGYADQALLEEVFARTLWRPPAALDFEHLEVRGDWPDVDGAVVMLPARHHASEDDVARLTKELDRLAWSVVVLCGDEEWVFPWQRIGETDTRRLWIMAPEPEHAGCSYLFPGGWYQNTRADIAAAKAEADERPLDWAFAGQVTHIRRKQCVMALRRLKNGYLLETPGFLQGLPPDEYARKIASAKVIPCPSGPVQVDTSRPLSAMEAGCVPIVDLQRPTGTQFDYWALVFGPDNPLRKIAEWSALPKVMAQEIHAWPANSNRVFAWWQQWKRRTAHKLDADVRAVAGMAPAPAWPDDLITVIIPSSPIPSHPSTAVIDETIASVREQLPYAEIIVVVDGVRPEQASRRADYEEYTRRLLWKANFEWHNVVPIVMDEWAHQANCTRAALELVTTSQVLFVEHDTPITGDIDWTGLCTVVGRGQANAIRLHIDVEINPEWEYLMVDHETQWIERLGPDDVGVPLRRAMQWWQRPHLASTAFYRGRVMAHFSPESRTFIEDHFYGIVSNDWHARGEAAWWDWRLWVYTPPGNMQRSRHLDGRDTDPKYEMWN